MFRGESEGEYSHGGIDVVFAIGDGGDLLSPVFVLIFELHMICDDV